MPFNTLLTAENLEELQFQNAETKKLLASHIPGIMDIPDVMPSILPPNYELGGNINVLPSPETDSLVSSPSISNPDDDLDLFGIQPLIKEQEQLLNNIPLDTQSVAAAMNSASYENALLNLIASNQLQSNIPVCEPLVNVNVERLLLNYPGLLSLKDQSSIVDSFDVNTAVGLNELPLNALDLLDQSNNIEVPSLVPSTIEPTVGSELIDPLLIGANNPFLMNELLETNALIPSNKMDKVMLNDDIDATSVPFEVSTPPLSPVNLNTLKDSKKFGYVTSQSPVEIPKIDFNSINASTTSNTQSVIINGMNPVVPTQEIVSMVHSEVPTPIFTSKVDVTKVQPIVSAKNIQTKTNYTYVPVTKKRSNSDLKGAKLERRSSNKSNHKKSVPMIKDKNGKSIQKQVKHTFVIETPGISYGRKTSGRKRKCKKENEEETFAALPQVPQIPCRQNVTNLPPQKLSKIHARTTEDLDSLPFQCEFCPSAFSRKHDLKRHIKVHIGNTAAYKCQHCGKSYARAESLVKHEASKECQK
jgi:hypothetical protein